MVGRRHHMAVSGSGIRRTAAVAHAQPVKHQDDVTLFGEVRGHAVVGATRNLEVIVALVVGAAMQADQDRLPLLGIDVRRHKQPGGDPLRRSLRHLLRQR
ncbi:hypothetical protein D3C84_1118730 [compost metagenome]